MVAEVGGELEVGRRPAHLRAEAGDRAQGAPEVKRHDRRALRAADRKRAEHHGSRDTRQRDGVVGAGDGAESARLEEHRRTRDGVRR